MRTLQHGPRQGRTKRSEKHGATQPSVGSLYRLFISARKIGASLLLGTVVGVRGYGPFTAFVHFALVMLALVLHLARTQHRATLSIVQHDLFPSVTSFVLSWVLFYNLVHVF